MQTIRDTIPQSIEPRYRVHFGLAECLHLSKSRVEARITSIRWHDFIQFDEAISDGRECVTGRIKASLEDSTR
jgi:hypothetical protein